MDAIKPLWIMNVTQRHGGIIHHCYFATSEAAMAARDVLASALQKHREFGNDEGATATVTDASGQHTFKVGEISKISVTLEDEARIREAYARDAAMFSLREEYGLPTRKAGA